MNEPTVVAKEYLSEFGNYGGHVSVTETRHAPEPGIATYSLKLEGHAYGDVVSKIEINNISYIQMRGFSDQLAEALKTFDK